MLEMESNFDKLKKFINSQSSKISNDANNIYKNLMAIGNKNKPALGDPNYYDFTDNELLKEIGNKNQRIFKKEEIIGELKNIYYE